VAALGKAYVRREEQPDDELFAGLLHKIGLDDDVAIAFLLAAWSVLRADLASPPGNAPASDAQWSFILKLAVEKGTVAPVGPFTKSQASAVIDSLQKGTYNADDYLPV
jgi:hypothetical protein